MHGILLIEHCIKVIKKKYSVKYVTGVNQIINGMYGVIIRSVFLFFYMWKWGAF